MAPSTMLHEVLFECLYIGVCCGCDCVEGLVGQGAWTAERHIMAAGIYGPSGQMTFNNGECISMNKFEVVTTQKKFWAGTWVTQVA